MFIPSKILVGYFTCMLTLLEKILNVHPKTKKYLFYWVFIALALNL